MNLELTFDIFVCCHFGRAPRVYFENRGSHRTAQLHQWVCMYVCCMYVCTYVICMYVRMYICTVHMFESLRIVCFDYCIQ